MAECLPSGLRTSPSLLFVGGSCNYRLFTFVHTTHKTFFALQLLYAFSCNRKEISSYPSFCILHLSAIFSSFYPLPVAKEMVVKLKGCLMFHPKNMQILLRISTLNKFLRVFYNHKYYSSCISNNLAYSSTTSQSSANTSLEEGTQESALPSGLMISI